MTTMAPVSTTALMMTWLGPPTEENRIYSRRRRARQDAEFVNYTKRAKCVDVRKLKENIWKGLRIALMSRSPTTLRQWCDDCVRT
jgi:hypothetical protein